VVSGAILITGGAGFIGSNFVRMWAEVHPDETIVVLDALTYAGNLANLADLRDDRRLRFYPGRIEDPTVVEGVFRCERITRVVNFAAESHNDRSMLDPTGLIAANVTGVSVLLEAAARHGVERFVHVSTDEVYGQIPAGLFTEDDPLLPRTPYSAGKAGGEMQVRAHHIAYGTPAIVTRGSNTFGPYQYPEKILPFFITRAMRDKPVPLYGDGHQVREWLYVDDHCAGIAAVLDRGVPGEAYNIGGGNESTNLDLTLAVLRLVGKGPDLIRRIADPRGAAHDARYALDCSKAGALGWAPRHHFDAALEATVRWYVDRRDWWEPIVNAPAYQAFVRRYYGPALGAEL
jgi:dTDP-glucose 4,6-dehydratase